MNVDGYWLPRHDQDKLIELLDQIPDLVEDLTIAITRQDRIAGGGPKTRNGSDEQPLPLSVEAMEAADLLTDTLASWVRHTTEQRAMHYTAPCTAVHYAAWLKRWHVALAMSPGSDEALDEIRYAVRQARRATDRRQPPKWMHASVVDASDRELDAPGIEIIARSIGGDYRTLTRKRVHNLRTLGHIEAIRMFGKVPIFRLGDVLAAHIAVPEKTVKRTA